jgi:hypothetical protein
MPMPPLCETLLRKCSYAIYDFFTNLLPGNLLLIKFDRFITNAMYYALSGDRASDLSSPGK